MSARTGLAVRGLVVRYEGPGKTPTTAVAGVDLDVEVGEILALLGPSGSGKSSLLRAVAGLEPAAAGSVSWDARDVTDVPVHRRGFGLMFQDGQLFPHRSVAGNVGYGLATAGVSRAARGRRVAELLGLVGLEGYGSRPVSTLSGGQAQRVALARSLAPAPQLLLLDEPLSALDRGLRERLTGELHDILRRTGTTALYVTHDHDEAFTVADRVAVMIDGRLAQVDEPARLWRAPVDRRVAAFLGYGPFLAAEVHDDVARTVLGDVPLRSDGRPGADLGAAAGQGATAWPGATAAGATAAGAAGRPGATAQPSATAAGAAGRRGAAVGHDVVVGLGPGALQVVTGEGWTGGDDVEVPVGTSRFVRGRTEVDVILPDGTPATAVAAGAVELPSRVQVRLDSEAAVVVPARESPAG